MVELKTHAAQLGWNTCNPSLLSGFAFCWQTLTVFHIICMAGTHTPMNQHIHTSHVTPIHTISTIRHYSFPLVVHTCKLLCCVLHGFAHKLCLFTMSMSVCAPLRGLKRLNIYYLPLFYKIFRAQIFNWFLGYSRKYIPDRLLNQVKVGLLKSLLQNGGSRGVVEKMMLQQSRESNSAL